MTERAFFPRISSASYPCLHLFFFLGWCCCFYSYGARLRPIPTPLTHPTTSPPRIKRNGASSSVVAPVLPGTWDAVPGDQLLLVVEGWRSSSDIRPLANLLSTDPLLTVQRRLLVAHFLKKTKDPSQSFSLGKSIVFSLTSRFTIRS